LRCTVDPFSVSPGEQVVIDASESTGVNVIDYDVDGDGEYERRERTNLTTTVVYEAPGTYEPRVRVHAGDQVEECGTTTVEDGNQPPVAVFTVDPSVASPGELVSFNASDSYDPDGRIVQYRWDFNGNGTIDAATNGFLTQHTYPETSRYRPALVVVDNDGATDRAELTVRVVSGTPLLGLQWLLPVILGGLLGFLACRARHFGYFPKPFGGGSTSGAGVTAHSAGTFETPPGGGTVTVDGIGFEPDVVLLTATSSMVADGPALDRTDSWSYGAATRNTDGSLSQQALAVATDARTSGRGFATAVSDGCLELPLHQDDEVVTLSGTVGATHEDGFEVDFDASDLPPDRYDEEYVVLFEAFETKNASDADIGFFTTPGQEAVRSVDLGIEADYVRLTALDPLGESDATAETGERVAISHGQAAAEASISQRAVTGAVDPTTAGHTCHAAYEDRALHLLHGDHGSIDGRTSARVTEVGQSLELTFDQVYAAGRDESGGDAGAGDGPADAGAGGNGTGEKTEDPTAPPRLVGFVALDTGDGPSPSLGRIEAPVEVGPERVDVGFEPEVIEFTAMTMSDVGEESSVARSPLGFGWSHGTALIDAGGLVHHSVLHSSVDGQTATGSGPLSTPVTRAEAGTIGGVAPPGATAVPVDVDGLAATDAVEDLPGDVSPDGGQPEGTDTAGKGTGAAPADRTRVGAGALGYVVDAAGRVRRREDVRVTGVDRTGFAVERRLLGDDTIAEAGISQPVVFYTAWPEATESEL
jgi:PKD repeat protein